MVAMSPKGMVTRVLGAGCSVLSARCSVLAAISARTNANSTAESIGTSSSSRPAGSWASRVPPPLSARVAASKSVARSVALALVNCWSNRSSRTARSGPPRGSELSRPAPISARRSSCSVRASARGKPGVFATGAKYCSAASRCASKVARAATASEPRYVTGASPCAARIGAARRAASCVRLKRWSPIVAPAAAAIDRARSSTAPRDAPTSHTSPRAACVSTNARASLSRSCAEEDSIRRIIACTPRGRHAGSSSTTAPRGRQNYPRGFAPRTPLHALSRAATSARSVRVARSLRSLATAADDFRSQLLDQTRIRPNLQPPNPDPRSPVPDPRSPIPDPRSPIPDPRSPIPPIPD